VNFDPRRAARTAARAVVMPLLRTLRPLPRLDRYEPEMTLRLPTHSIEAARFPAIDVHNHLGRWLHRRGGWMEPDVGLLVSRLDECNIRSIINLDGRWGSELEANLDRYDRAFPGRIATFCHLNWDLLRDRDGIAHLLGSLEQSADQGACGIKVWKDLGRKVKDATGKLVLLDSGKLGPLWDKAAELKLPVLVHIGDPLAFFRPVDRHNERLEELHRYPSSSWRRKGLPDHERLLAALESTVSRHPETTWIAAHMASCCEDLIRLGAMLDDHPNLNIDTAARLGDLGRQPRAARRLFTDHPDRILFGTDCFPVRPDEIRRYLRFFETDDEYFPYSTRAVPPAGRWHISALALEDRVLRAVYGDNARRLVPRLGSVSRVGG
jgi:predicted TIM-barrel fold metal-dependent hydrolase